MKRVIFTLVGIFFLSSSVLLAKDPKNDNEKDKTKKCDKEKLTEVNAVDDALFMSGKLSTDSLSDKKPEKQKAIEEKSDNQPSLSTISYNIIFQMIYRFSFSEIFDSSHGGSDNDAIQIMN